LNDRLAKLLQIAFDSRCSDGERIAASNAAARIVGAEAIEALLAASARKANAESHFAFGLEQQLELLQSQISERDRALEAARAEIAQLKSGLARPVDDGLDLKAVIDMTGWSRATLYRRMADGRFPLPAATHGTRKFWSKNDLAEWTQTGITQ